MLGAELPLGVSSSTSAPFPDHQQLAMACLTQCNDAGMFFSWTWSCSFFAVGAAETAPQKLQLSHAMLLQWVNQNAASHQSSHQEGTIASNESILVRGIFISARRYEHANSA
jgi:hypothetical protein